MLAGAEPDYASALAGIGRLPFRSVWAVAASRSNYRDIGVGVHGGRAGHVVVGPTRKLVRVAGGAFAALAVRVVAGLDARPRHGLWTRPA